MNPQSLTALREARGWTKADLSRRADLPSAHISRIEGGFGNITWETLEKLANAFDLSLAELVAALDVENTPAQAAA